MEFESKEGVIVFLLTNQGSKSECLLPHLYLGRDFSVLPLYMEDDNPFENKAFKEYDGCRVRVHGEYGSNNIFIVKNVEAISLLSHS